MSRRKPLTDEEVDTFAEFNRALDEQIGVARTEERAEIERRRANGGMSIDEYEAALAKLG